MTIHDDLDGCSIFRELDLISFNYFTFFFLKARMTGKTSQFSGVMTRKGCEGVVFGMIVRGWYIIMNIKLKLLNT